MILSIDLFNFYRAYVQQSEKTHYFQKYTEYAPKQTILFWAFNKPKQPLYTVGENVNYYSHCAKQYGGSSKN
jgi:hypothetical protein